MRDLYSNMRAVAALAPVALAATGNTGAVDTLGGRGAMLVVSVGAITGAAAFSVKLQDSADGTTFADAPAALVQSNAPAVLEANGVYRLGYIGSKRFVRAVLTKASGTSALIGVVAIVEPLLKPVA